MDGWVGVKWVGWCEIGDVDGWVGVEMGEWTGG